MIILECQICKRQLVNAKKIDEFIYACACGTHFSMLTFFPVADYVTHCRCCYALIDKRFVIDGFGLECGCAHKAYKELKSFANSNGFDI